MMKSWTSILVFGLATAVSLRGLQHDSHNHGKRESVEDHMSFVTGLLDGKHSNRDLEAAITRHAEAQSWEQVVASGKVDLPGEVVSMLNRKKHNKGKKVSQDFDEDALDRARKTLNGLIESARAEYDLKKQECSEFEISNRATFNQIESDLSRLGKQIAGDNAKIMSARAKTEEMMKSIADVQSELDDHEYQCKKTKRQNKATLKMLKNDLEIAEFILEMTRCKEFFFMQLPKNTTSHKANSPYTVVDCKSGHKVSLSFTNDTLAEKVAAFSSIQAKEAFRAALLNSGIESPHKELHLAEIAQSKKQIAELTMSYRSSKTRSPEDEKNFETTTETTTFMEFMRTSTTTPAPQVDDKCTYGKPDCGLLTDNMALMWGEVKDAVDELTAIMSAEQERCTEISGQFNKDISDMQATIANMDVQLADGTASLNADTQEQSERQADRRAIEAEYAERMQECKDTLYEILFTNICGVKTIRGELTSFSDRVRPVDIIDCEVTDWVKAECSAECEGGIQNLTREVTQEASIYGTKCPVMRMLRPCNEIACPIDCAMGKWSPYGKCTKECGGGMQQRSRNIFTRAANGGASCLQSTESQSCNVGACDVDCELDKWSDFGVCSKACDKGIQKRHRPVKVEALGAGLCPLPESEDRMEFQECNTLNCPANPKCAGKQDIILAVDVSGSLKQEGFDLMKQFVASFFDYYLIGEEHAQIGIVEYSDKGRIVVPMTTDVSELESGIEDLYFQRGVTNMASALSMAGNMLMEGRPDATSLIIMLTDGKPSLKWNTKTAAKPLKDGGVRIAIVPVMQAKEEEFLRELASSPDDYIDIIPSLDKLEALMPEKVAKIMTSTCPILEHPPVQNKPMNKPPFDAIGL